MYVEILKADVIVFIGKVIMRLTSHWLIIFIIPVSLLILTISLTEIKKKVQIMDNFRKYVWLLVLNWVH